MSDPSDDRNFDDDRNRTSRMGRLQGRRNELKLVYLPLNVAIDKRRGLSRVNVENRGG